MWQDQLDMTKEPDTCEHWPCAWCGALVHTHDDEAALCDWQCREAFHAVFEAIQGVYPNLAQSTIFDMVRAAGEVTRG